MVEFSDESYNLRIELDTKNCDVSADEVAEIERSLDPLGKVVHDFPVSDLYLTIIHHARSHDYHVKTALRLPRKTLFTGDRDPHVHAAFERCVRKLVKKVHAYKERLSDASEAAKREEGTHQEILPTQEPDVDTLTRAVQNGDYAAFRRATDVYEEPLNKRIGRWVQRYPEVESELGNRFNISDIVEEVFLNAFERYEQKPQSLTFHDWLENLIDPSVKLMMRHPEEEMENINFSRTLTEAEREGGTG